MKERITGRAQLMKLTQQDPLEWTFSGTTVFHLQLSSGVTEWSISSQTIFGYVEALAAESNSTKMSLTELMLISDSLCHYN